MINNQTFQPRQALSRPLSRRSALGIFGLAGAALALAGCGSNKGAYPSDALEYVIPYNPGGSTDPIGREFGRLLGENLGTSSTPLNMPGGDESIGATHVSNADPDGYTLGLASTAGLIGQPMLNPSLSYKGAEDFTPIIKMVTVPYALMVAGNSPYQTLEQFLEAASADPRGMRIGTPNRMGGSAFALYALEEAAGIQTTLVPATGGSGETALSVMGGRLEGMIGTASGQMGLIEAGDMRALAYSGTGYEEFLPDAVSFEGAGFDVPFAGDYVTIAPAGLPEDIRTKLVTAGKEVAAGKEWLQFCKNQAILPDSLVGGEIDAWLAASRDNLQKAIKLAGSREG
jgi:putative tricarboxylic transport membrane protein